MSNFNPGNYYRNIDRYGSEIVNEGAPDFVPTPISYTPTASGNTSNINQFVVDPQGDIYFIDADGEAFKVNTTQTVTTITDTKTGSKIATYTNENGVAVDINETITSLQTFSITGDVITIEYIAEDGVTTTKTITLPSDVVTTITNAVTGHKIADYTNESGTVVSINETVTSIGTITYDSITGVLTIPYTDENSTVNSKTVTIPTAPIEVLDEINATAGQTLFTLSGTPVGAVKMTRNGVLLPKAAWTVSGTTVTYIPASNNNNLMKLNDRVEFFYEY